MKRLLRHRPSPAMIVALVAVVIATAGTATALPGIDVVTKNDIRRGAVGKSEARANSIGQAELIEGRVGINQIGTDAVGSDEIAPDTVGTDELANGSVERENIGASAVTAEKTSRVKVRTNEVPLNDGTNASAQVSCGAGERMLAGGGNVGAFGSDLHWLSSRPSTPGGQVPAPETELNTWRTSAINVQGNPTGNTTLRVWATCLE